jgi:hypothetical protein
MHDSQFITVISSNKLRVVYDYIILCKITKLIIYYYILYNIHYKMNSI